MPDTTTTKDRQLTWYGFGEKLAEGLLPSRFSEEFYKSIPGFIPSTYDASRAYVDAELQKPEAQRDLHKEMCLILPIAIPGNRKLHVIVPSQKLIIPIYKGSMMLIPAVNLPPDTFGTRADPYSQNLIDAVEPGPQSATILMAYVTRAT